MKQTTISLFIIWLFFSSVGALAVKAAPDSVERYGVFEATFMASGTYANPFTELSAEAVFTCPDGSTRTIPLFWDGGLSWKFRISPDVTGKWTYSIHSADKGLNGKSGSFTCNSSSRRGSIQNMQGYPTHFQYQNGEPVWFMGETAWALFTDDEKEKHNRTTLEEFLTVRASQDFTAVHSMVLSEAGWGNSGGMPFTDMAAQVINPDYWKEMDQRVKSANEKGLVVGLAIAWGDKNNKVPFPWRLFPNLEARKNYARYIAARYSAYDVYFLVSGEWHAEIRTRPAIESELKKEFMEIGDALDQADPHGRMIGIHPMTSHGSVREFNEAGWMSFGDYQQNYDQIHNRILESLKFFKPVLNSEYGYFLRDQNGDGVPDKDNSTSIESMRHASWDIVMAGGYFVTGFGTTYFGGIRDPGSFDVHAVKNDAWEMQVGLIRKFFSELEWWKLLPKDQWLTSASPRGNDGKHLGQAAPPVATYWLLAEPGREYIVYARGMSAPVVLQADEMAKGRYRARLFNPRTGTVQLTGEGVQIGNSYSWIPPDSQDWILRLTKENLDIR